MSMGIAVNCGRNGMPLRPILTSAADGPRQNTRDTTWFTWRCSQRSIRLAESFAIQNTSRTTAIRNMANETPENSAPRVLISYSQESDSHSQRVLSLANKLRSHGIDVMIDRYDPHPPEGWPMWMERQITQSSFVVCVFTETYRRRAMGEETPGRGKGVAWEADIIRECLYDEPHLNTKFIPVVFDPAHEQFIIHRLRSSTRYQLNDNDIQAGIPAGNYERLYRQLTAQPEVIKPTLGQFIKLDPVCSPMKIVAANSGETQNLPASAPREPFTSPETTQPASGSIPVASKGTVLVPEPRSDVKAYADDFIRYLREAGFEVIVPDPFAVDRDFRENYQQALKQSLLVVQILGADPFPRTAFLTEDETNVRLEDWIWLQAQLLEKQTLRWRPPAIDLKCIVEVDYRNVLASAIKCDAEDFKKTDLREMLSKLKVKPMEKGRKIFVRHHSSLSDTADNVGAKAEEFGQGLKIRLTDENIKFADWVGDHPVDGLLVVYGTDTAKWASESVDEVHEAAMATNMRHGVLRPQAAIVKQNPETPSLMERPPGWKVLQASDDEALRTFVVGILKREVKP